MKPFNQNLTHFRVAVHLFLNASLWWPVWGWLQNLKVSQLFKTPQLSSVIILFLVYNCAFQRTILWLLFTGCMCGNILVFKATKLLHLRWVGQKLCPFRELFFFFLLGWGTLCYVRRNSSCFFLSLGLASDSHLYHHHSAMEENDFFFYTGDTQS